LFYFHVLVTLLCKIVTCIFQYLHLKKKLKRILKHVIFQYYATSQFFIMLIIDLNNIQELNILRYTLLIFSKKNSKCFQLAYFTILMLQSLSLDAKNIICDRSPLSLRSFSCGSYHQPNESLEMKFVININLNIEYCSRIRFCFCVLVDLFWMFGLGKLQWWHVQWRICNDRRCNGGMLQGQNALVFFLW
jgi:hypothetical protein